MRFDKDPDAILDYASDWSGWLAAGETITSHLVLIEPSGLHLDQSDHTSTAVVAWLSGGVAGVKYKVTYRIVSSGGRVDDRTVRVDVANR